MTGSELEKKAMLGFALIGALLLGLAAKQDLERAKYRQDHGCHWQVTGDEWQNTTVKKEICEK